MTVRDPQTEPRTDPQTEPRTDPAPAPEPAPAALAASEPSPARVCPRCATPLREEQDWCLACGAAATSRIAAPEGWRAPLAVIAAVVALAFAALLVAFLAISDDSDELTRLAAQGAATQAATPAPTPPAPAPTPTPAASPTPGAGQTVPPASTTGPGDDLPGLDGLPEAGGGADDDAGATAGGTGTGGEVGTWPSGRSAFTVVLLSSPSRAGANRRARELAGSGTDVGVLDSDEFRSLRGGYFVVFSGQYGSRDAAEDALQGLSDDAPGAYVRRVTPR